jgi:acyl-CoA synthetase (AMP-forming)/AMP-acid ligase II
MAYVRERKGPVQTTKRIEIVDRIPQSAAGKPDKKEPRMMTTARIAQQRLADRTASHD